MLNVAVPLPYARMTKLKKVIYSEHRVEKYLKEEERS